MAGMVFCTRTWLLMSSEDARSDLKLFFEMWGCVLAIFLAWRVYAGGLDKDVVNAGIRGVNRATRFLNSL